MTQQELEKRLQKAEVVRSSRRTLAIEVRPDGTIRIRAPRFCPDAEIRRFVRKNRSWIVRKLDLMEKRKRQAEKDPAAEPLSEQDIRDLADRAKTALPPRVRIFAERMHVTYGRITIRSQKTRWGSCSSKGNLNFNCLLMLAPSDVQDYVLVHELAHRKEMNHSARFWAAVEEILPDYRRPRRWLREEGAALIGRLRQM